MRLAEAKTALQQFPTLEVTSIEEILGGWANWTFEVNQVWIFRFPRTSPVAESTTRELALLPFLESKTDVEIPVPRWVGRWNHRPFFGYRKILGCPLEGRDLERNEELAAELAAALAQLHSVDARHACRLLGADGSTNQWRRRYEDLRQQAVSRVLRHLEVDVRRRLNSSFDEFLERSFDFDPVLIHRDLGSDHILVDPDDSSLVGLIDFEDATVGDPAIDFVGLQLTLGKEQARRVLEAYATEAAGSTVLDCSFALRIVDYCWLGSLHAVLHGLAVDDDAILADGFAGLRERLPVAE